MCFSAKVPKVPPKPEPPKKDENSFLLQEAKLRARNARGAAGNIFTSALGDPNFGQSVRLPGATKLGQTS